MSGSQRSIAVGDPRWNGGSPMNSGHGRDFESPWRYSLSPDSVGARAVLGALRDSWRDSRCVLGLVLLLLVVLPASAAAEMRWPSGTVAQPFSTWANASPLPLPPGDVAVVMARCPLDVGGVEASACTGPGQPIYLEPSRLEGQMRDVFLHELGHQFDFRVLTHADRMRLAAAMHAPLPWFNGAEPSGAEWFAEAYSTCSRRGLMRVLASGPRSRRVWLRYDWQPTARRTARICSLIRDVRSTVIMGSALGRPSLRVTALVS